MASVGAVLFVIITIFAVIIITIVIHSWNCFVQYILHVSKQA